MSDSGLLYSYLEGGNLATEFNGKTALVTGASRGIGAATAIKLAQAGVRRVIVHYNSFPEGAQATVAAIRAMGVESEAIQASLGNMAGVRAFLETLSRTAPEVDILVNNAGSLVKRASAGGLPRRPLRRGHEPERQEPVVPHAGRGWVHDPASAAASW